MIGVGDFSLGPNAEKYVGEVLANRRLSYGPFLRKFEEEVARAHGVRFAIMSNSGTSALQVALQALKEKHGWKDGDEVIVPAVTFVATGNIVVHNNMRPVFVDVERDYYGMDPARFEAAITPRTRAVIPVHLFGQPADMDPILEIARRNGLAVIEDSCETMFARYKGRSVGSFGDAAAFSTYIAHILSTGVGGLTVTGDTDLAVRIRSLVNHGRDSIYFSMDDSKEKAGSDLKLVIAKRFSFVSFGHSFRATELEGALGLAHIEDAERQIAARRAIARRLTEELEPLSGHLRLPRIRPGSEHSFMMYPILLNRDEKDRVTYELESRGIETRDMLPIVNQPAYVSRFGTREEDYPVAAEINRRGFYIGCHPGIADADVEHIANSFREIFAGIDRAAPKRETVALVLVDPEDPAGAERMAGRIPQDLFDEVLVVGGEGPASDALRRRGLRVVACEDRDPGRRAAAGVRATSASAIVLMSLSGEHDPGDLERIVFQLRRGADVVIASRYLPESRRADQDRGVTMRGTGNRFLSLVLNQRYNTSLTDPYSTFRGFRRAFFPADRESPADPSRRASFSAPGTTLGWELTLHAVRSGAKITEVSTWEGPPRRSRTAFSLAVNGVRALSSVARGIKKK